ncbi:hypothetical protein ACP70R_003119 [Stipagrostis hirtigluma subsp. patula]
MSKIAARMSEKRIEKKGIPQQYGPATYIQAIGPLVLCQSTGFKPRTNKKRSKNLLDLLIFSSAVFHAAAAASAAVFYSSHLEKILGHPVAAAGACGFFHSGRRPSSSSPPPRHMPARTTASTCIPVADQAKHVFEIIGYSKHKGMGRGGDCFIRSRTFSVGGHDWSIRFYPDGYSEDNEDYVSVYVELMSCAKLRASCDIRLVDQSTGLSSSVDRTEPRMFNYGDNTRYAPQTYHFMERSALESSVYLQDDRLVIECIVTVMRKPRVCENKWCRNIEVPPSDIGEHLGKLLAAGEGADVTFSVGGQTFKAHKFVLAMRSPVFKAELWGPMMEARTQHVAIGGMQPAVFKVLLNFIYTDSLPPMDDLAEDDRVEMIRHLLVAADRYAIDRLKLMCESMLCKVLNVNNLAATLALADQHHCGILKDSCIEFISSSAMDNVMAIKGFEDLKKSCPSVLVDVFVKMSNIK